MTNARHTDSFNQEGFKDIFNHGYNKYIYIKKKKNNKSVFFCRHYFFLKQSFIIKNRLGLKIIFYFFDVLFTYRR